MEAVKVLGQLKYIKNYVKVVYKRCVESVNSKLLIKNNLTMRNNILLIKDVEVKLNKNVYVIGFGKAALDMAMGTEEILGHHIRGGAVSVPEGSIKIGSDIPRFLKVYEGAKGNLPDTKSISATKNILDSMNGLKSEDIVLVLISGGGSALLAHPVPPLTLEEKLFVTTNLTNSGANIIELNAVRKKLSLVKGGKLSRIVQPARVISLVLSDVVNDPLDVIASGPTVQDNTPRTLAIDVLKKYDLMQKVPPNVLGVLNDPEMKDVKSTVTNSFTFLIGNNSLALKSGEEFTVKDGFISKVMTSNLVGNVDQVATGFAKLAGLLCQALGKTINNKIFLSELEKLSSELCMPMENIDALTSLIFQCNCKNKVCLFFGGETTVKITGNGKGGRNQELALRFSLALDELSKTLHVVDLFNVVLLCAGTDGIDGPTDAAGAIAYNGQSLQAWQQNINPQKYLANNDSYTYFSLFNEGEDQLKYGNTGTNVMDIIILTVESKME